MSIPKVDGRITISDSKDFNIEDLLNRDQVIPDDKLLSKNINSKTVLVTKLRLHWFKSYIFNRKL